MFEFGGVFINPFEIASAHIASGHLAQTFLTITLSSGDSFQEVYDTREEALSIVNEISEIINPADFYEDEEEDWI